MCGLHSETENGSQTFFLHRILIFWFGVIGDKKGREKGRNKKKERKIEKKRESVRKMEIPQTTENEQWHAFLL